MINYQEVLMYLKRGSLISLEKTENPHLQTPEGQKYEVNYIAAYVWDLLDGSKSASDVAEIIEDSGNLKDYDLPKIVTKIIDELEKVNLVEPLKKQKTKIPVA